MLLAVDIGNSNIVAGVFSGEVLVARWRLATEARKMPDEYAVTLSSLFDLAGLSALEIDGVIMCSVVPSVQAAVSEAIHAHWHRQSMLVTSHLDLGIDIRYSPPTAVGADRIANAVAAIAGYGTPAIVVDFGTGTNIDVISRDGAYLGGAIAPGLEVSEEALISRTAQLPRVPLMAPESAIGKTTLAALQSGIVLGYAGLVDGLVGRIQVELGGGAHVIATGGLATTIAPLACSIEQVDPDLTLIGLRILYERNV